MAWEAISIASLRQMNTYDLTGYLPSQGDPWEAAILRHLGLLQALRALLPEEEAICRMVAESYSAREIARELGVSNRTIHRRLRELRWSLYGVDAAEALQKR